MRAIHRSLPERAAARLLTGAAGHLYGGVLDWLELALRWRAQRRAVRRSAS